MQESFSTVLLSAIKASGLSRAEIAARAGITAASLSHYIRGRNLPKRETIARMSEALHADLSCVDVFRAEAKPAIGRVSIVQASRLLGVSPNQVRIGIARGIFPFGVVISGENCKRNYYYISPGKLREFVGEREFDEFFNQDGSTNGSAV